MFRISDRALFVGGSAVAQAARIVSGIVLARLLTKEDYGRYQMVISLAGMVSAFGDFGVYRFITSRQDITLDDALDAAGSVTLVVYSAYALVASLSGLYCWGYYDDPRLLFVGFANAAFFIASGLYSLQSAVLARDMRFARMAGAEATTIILTALAAVGLAAAGAGYFALALPPLAAQTAALALVYRHTGVRWPRSWGGAVLKQLFTFGWRNAVFEYLNTLQWNLYYLLVGYMDAPGVVGKTQRAAAVGVFGRAVNVCSLFGFNLTLAVDKVVYPLLCNAQNDRERFASLFVRGSAIFIAVGGAGAVVLPSIGADLVIAAMGPAWLPSARLMTVLSLGLWFVGFMRLSTSAAMIEGRPLVPAAFCLLQVLLVAPAGWVYLQYGDLYYCLALAVAQASVTFLFLLYTLRRLQIPVSVLFARLAPLVFVLIGSGLAMFLARRGLLTWDPEPGRFLPAVLRLAVCGTVGLAVGILGLLSFDRPTLEELRGLIVRKRAA